MKWYCGVPASRRRIGTTAVFHSEHITRDGRDDLRGMYRLLRSCRVDPSAARLVLSSAYLTGVSTRKEPAE